MRCLCCNRNLSDYESTLRHPETLAFLDICKKCLVDIPITPLENKDNSDEVNKVDEYQEYDGQDVFDLDCGEEEDEEE